MLPSDVKPFAIKSRKKHASGTAENRYNVVTRSFFVTVHRAIEININWGRDSICAKL